MVEQVPDKSLVLSSEEQADLDDIKYHWDKVKHYAACLQDRKYDVSISGLISATSCDLEIRKLGDKW